MTNQERKDLTNKMIKIVKVLLVQYKLRGATRTYDYIQLENFYDALTDKEGMVVYLGTNILKEVYSIAFKDIFTKEMFDSLLKERNKLVNLRRKRKREENIINDYNIKYAILYREIREELKKEIKKRRGEIKEIEDVLSISFISNHTGKRVFPLLKKSDSIYQYFSRRVFQRICFEEEKVRMKNGKTRKSKLTKTK